MNSKVSIITIMTVAVLAGCNRNDGPETPSPVPDKQIEVETLSRRRAWHYVQFIGICIRRSVSCNSESRT